VVLPRSEQDAGPRKRCFVAGGPLSVQDPYVAVRGVLTVCLSEARRRFVRQDKTSRDRPYKNFVRFQSEDSSGGISKQYRSKGRTVRGSGLYCVRNPICRKQEIFMKP
jgi:hypothetical protein